MLAHEELMAEREIQVKKKKSSRGEKLISKYKIIDNFKLY